MTDTRGDDSPAAAAAPRPALTPEQAATALTVRDGTFDDGRHGWWDVTADGRHLTVTFTPDDGTGHADGARAASFTARVEPAGISTGLPWQVEDVVRDADAPDDPALYQFLPDDAEDEVPWKLLGRRTEWLSRDALPHNLALVVRAGLAAAP